MNNALCHIFTQRTLLSQQQHDIAKYFFPLYLSCVQTHEPVASSDDSRATQGSKKPYSFSDDDELRIIFVD